MRRLLPLFLIGVLIAACEPVENDPITDQPQPPAGMKRPDPKAQDVTVDMIQQGVVTCTFEWPPGQCQNYTWTNAPLGFQNCSGDPSTYDGELTLHTVINFKEYCLWAHPAANHATMAWPVMNDWDGPILRTFTMNSRLHGGGFVFSGQGQNGSFFSWLGPDNGGPSSTYRELPWYIRSGSINN